MVIRFIGAYLRLLAPASGKAAPRATFFAKGVQMQRYINFVKATQM
jgi:hypothetical protein